MKTTSVFVALALVSLASSQICGTNTFACPQGGNSAQLELATCSGCCCRLGYVPVNQTNSCDCVATTQSTGSFSCGAFGYQCPVDDSRPQLNCGGCCCNYGFQGMTGGCGCVVASATPAPSPVTSTPSPSTGAIPSPAAVCGAFAYQCPVADDRAIGSCSGCCCQYGYESSGSGCGCVAASVTPASSPAPSASSGSFQQPTCGLFSYQCAVTDERAISGCDGCCCNYGYESASGCNCQVASTSASPLPTAASSSNTCGTFSYQCAVTDERAISGCDGCCCMYGYESSGSCNCAAASSSPAVSPNNSPAPTQHPTCGAFSYQCNPSDPSANPDCSGCCCNYGYSYVAGTCGCQLASKTPAPTPVTPSPSVTHINTCSSNAYQCATSDPSAIPGCGGCCCNWGYVPGAGCACVAASKSASATPHASPSTAPQTCGAQSYQCGTGSNNANANCPGCCCNYGSVPVGSGSCACTTTPTPSPPAVQTCGSNSFQCQVGSTGSLSGCGSSSFGCCCFYGYSQVASTCGCAAASKTPSPTPNVVTNHAQCGTNTFNCGGVGSANQVALTSNSACSQCCCFWGYHQVGTTCACSA